MPFIWIHKVIAIATTTVSVLAHGQMKTEFVYNGAAKIETFSVGKGPLILIVPSASRGADDYDTFATSLSAHGYHVVCVNPRGIGKSSPAADATMHDNGDDLATVIRHDSDKPAIVIGHAGGSFAARVLATEHPELVRGVVLAAPGAKQPDPALGEALKKLTANNLPDEERLKLLRFAFFASTSDASVWLRGWYSRPGGLPVSPAGSTTGVDSRDLWWGAGHAKVLELLPLQDAFRPAPTRGDYKAQYGDRVTVVTIPNAGHALFPEQPKAVENAILTWIPTL